MIPALHHKLKSSVSAGAAIRLRVCAVKLKISVLALAAALAGAVSCASRPAVQLDPASRYFYDTARLILTAEEADIFDQLPDAESRREFIADFWAKRDPDPETEANEFKDEFVSRIAYADEHFREGQRGMNTDRGRIYVYLGPPDKTEYFPLVRQNDFGSGAGLWWIYYRYELGIEFHDAHNMNSFKMVHIDGNLMQAIEDAKLGVIAQSAGSLGRFLDFDLSYDKSKKALTVTLPVKRINFKEEAGVLKAEFEFLFYIYSPGAASKDEFSDTREVQGRSEDFEKKKVISFAFPHELAAGKFYIDAVIVDKGGPGKARRIFTVRN